MEEKQRNLRVVLVPCPLQGHITPMIELATILYSKGFSITIAHTLFNSPNPSNHPKFTFLPITDYLIDPDTSPENNISLSNKINANCEAPFKNSMAQMMERNDKVKVVCIIYDRLMVFAQAVASQMKLPTIILRTSGASSVLAYNAIPRLQDEGYIPFQDFARALKQSRPALPNPLDEGTLDKEKSTNEEEVHSTQNALRKVTQNVDEVVNVELGKIKDKCNSSSSVVSPLSRSRKGSTDEDGYTWFVLNSKLEDPVPGLHLLRFKDISLAKLGNLEQILQVIVAARNTRTSAIIWNTIDYLEHSSLSQLHQQYFQVPFFSIGPLHKMAPTSSTSLLIEDTTCIEWLDKQAPRSVIYVSFGSLVNIDEKELAEMAWGLVNSGQPFLWVIRPGSIRGSQWIELLPKGFKEETKERSVIVKWAPQKEVLAHGAVGGFLSHCGWNSTLESISEGVPMICMPNFADQNVNARYLSHVWKVGLQMECELERGEMERAIRRLIVGKEGAEMRQRAIAMKEKIELSMRKGGSSYNSVNDLVEFILSLQSPK
ncbi:hypothetical protein LguiB_031132 [Lonicera macranthoides]